MGITYNPSFISNYSFFKDYTNIINSFGETLRTYKKVPDSEEEMTSFLKTTTDNLKEKLINEYITSGRLGTDVNGKVKKIRFDTREEADEYITPVLLENPIVFESVLNSAKGLGFDNNASPDDFIELSRGFIRSGFDNFSSAVMNQYNYVSENKSKITDIQSLLRDLTLQFIDRLIVLKRKEESDKLDNIQSSQSRQPYKKRRRLAQEEIKEIVKNKKEKVEVSVPKSRMSAKERQQQFKQKNEK